MTKTMTGLPPLPEPVRHELADRFWFSYTAAQMLAFAEEARSAEDLVVACREWLKGCTCAPAGKPWECVACTEAFHRRLVRLTEASQGLLYAYLDVRAAAAPKEQPPEDEERQ